MSIHIRQVESLAEIEHFRVLEHLIWGEALEATIPVHVLVTTIHNGGAILGAYADDGPAATGGMVGLTYWWPGLDTPRTMPDGALRLSESAGASALRLKMCSHMAGVLPPWRGTGLGLRLKLAQREVILAQAMTDWVTWTFDPLIRTNAAFNLHRLGAVCNTYHANLYGELPDALNAGVPSDRCQVDWWLNSPRVVERVSGDEWRRHTHLPPLTQVLSSGRNGHGLPLPPSALPHLDGSPLALPLPDDIYAVRSADAGLGAAWQQWMRAALEGAFAAGYVTVDCARHEDGQWRYLLMA